jgi:hypothetical protein
MDRSDVGSARSPRQGVAEALVCVFANGLEHAEAGLAIHVFQPAHKAAVGQLLQPVEQLMGGQRGISAHGFRRLQSPASGKNRKAPEQHLFVWCEQVEAPGQRAPQRLLAVG